MDAASAYASLNAGDRQTINRNIEHWALPSDQPKTWLHGFPNDRICKKCFVFRLGDHRLYGFLCNPLPKSDGRFQLCVLLIHSDKHQWETEPSIKRKIEQWRTHPAVKDAIAYVYKDSGGNKTWTN